jgi:hypothetical protein
MACSNRIIKLIALYTMGAHTDMEPNLTKAMATAATGRNDKNIKTPSGCAETKKKPQGFLQGLGGGVTKIIASGMT